MTAHPIKEKLVSYGDVGATLWLDDSRDALARVKTASVDLIVSSPPYFIGKSYDESKSLSEFIDLHNTIFPELTRVLKPGGSICWQVGHHYENGRLTPLDAVVYSISLSQKDLVLRNRIIWTFGHGLHATRRFSGRHETILWYSKGTNYFFDLDAVRVPQTYPGKKSYKGKNSGNFSGNPNGKNPSDVWDIPNVKSRHPEKTTHPCQYPVALAGRLVRALAPPGGMVLDPFMGVGTTGVAALCEGRSFLGIEMATEYVNLAEQRLLALTRGELVMRSDAPPRTPRPTEAVAIRPSHFVG
jgi:adenine-specific DNA-methyltransferase